MSQSRFSVFVLCSLYLVQTSHSSSVFEMFAKAVSLCYRKHNVSLSDCVKERSLIALDNVYRSENEINVISDFISLVRCDETSAHERSAKVLLSDIENESPQNRSAIVDNLIVRRIYDFLESRAFNVKIPITALDVFGILDDADEEGRGKQTGRGKKDKSGMMAVGAMFAGTMMAMKLAAVAALAGKALMASMMATIFAAVAALSKKSSTHGSTYEVINVPPHGHHARRSMVDASYSKRYQQQGEPTYNEIPEIDTN